MAESDEQKDINKIYMAVNKDTGSVTARINLKDKVASELLKMGWKNQDDIITIITEKEGKKGIWIELF